MNEYQDVLTFQKLRHGISQHNRGAVLDWRDSPFADHGGAPAGSPKPSGAAW